MYVSLENDQLEEVSKSLQRSLFQSPETSSVLINAFNKYRLAVKQHIDPDINSEESVLLLAALIDKLAETLPNRIAQPETNANFLEKIKKIIFRLKIILAKFRTYAAG